MQPDPSQGHGHGAVPGSSDVRQKLPGIGHLIAVASGKGGVGKSTVSVNLALALRQAGGKIGLVDADVFGPSIPGMLGLSFGDMPNAIPEGKIIPPEPYGMKVISMGMLTPDDNPAILRGPMVGKYLSLFMDQVAWGEQDALVLDLPPGTGDTQLTLAQSFPLSGAIIVTTPQDVSLKIARRGLRMFETVHVPILGIIENMSTFTCPHCGGDTDVFRRGGGERMSEELRVPFLGAIPLDPDIVTGGDSGSPIVIDKPDSVAARAYMGIAAALTERLVGVRIAGLRPFKWTWDTGEGEPDWMQEAVLPSGSPTRLFGLRRRDARTLSLLWEDGRTDHLDVRDLRLACRCAGCVEETSGRALLDPMSVRPDIAPRVISSVGNYAITFGWNDGHSTGIYSFERLRALGELDTGGRLEDV